MVSVQVKASFATAKDDYFCKLLARDYATPTRRRGNM
jgi:hypothetical protein